MNLMIVEDELRLRNSIAHNLPWSRYGIEVTALAASGGEALRLLEQRKPDLLLLDIRLPDMDGLELARVALQTNRQMKLVFLSGHDDFHYAQTAVELGAFKYLLKPAGEEEIVGTVAAAAMQLRREIEERYSRLALQQKWDAHMPRLQEMFFEGWVAGRHARGLLAQRGAELSLDVAEGGRYAVMSLDMDPISEEETRFQDKDLPLLQFSLLCIAKEYACEEPGAYWCFPDASGRTVLIVRGRDGESDSDFLHRMSGTVHKLLSLTGQCLKLTASAGMGQIVSGEQVPLSYRQSVRALHERVILGHQIVIPYRERPRPESAPPHPPQGAGALELALETNNEREALRAAEEYYGAHVRSADSIDAVREHVLYWQSTLVRHIHSRGWSVREVAGDDYAYFRNADTLISQEQIREWFQRSVRHILNYSASQRSFVSNELVASAVQLVEQHMDSELSLYAVAERLFVNSSYLSRLFKEKTGKTFSLYVTERKMERAKELLLGGQRVQDAAGRVGYRDLSYFSKVFRKYWGVSPGEFRKH